MFKRIVTIIVLSVVFSGAAFADGTLISSWDYTTSGALFGLALHDTTGNLWCIDFEASAPGFFEYDTSGTKLTGEIEADDDQSTQDGAWNVTDDKFIVGRYDESTIDIYDGASGDFLGGLDGPDSWDKVWGVAFDDTTNTVYVGEVDEIAYGTYVDENTDINWTVIVAGTEISGEVVGLGTDGTKLYGTKRDSATTVYCYVWNLSGGVPTTSKIGYVDISEHYTGTSKPGAGCAWDGTHLWVVDQTDDTGSDTVREIDLGSVSIKAASLGTIKATFK